jgi:hypothetical protein
VYRLKSEIIFTVDLSTCKTQIVWNRISQRPEYVYALLERRGQEEIPKDRERQRERRLRERGD